MAELALGLIETRGMVSLVEATDAALKAADWDRLKAEATLAP